MTEEESLSHAEAAEFLGISTASLYALVSYGTLTPERVPTRDGARTHYNFFNRKELEQYKAHRDAKPYRTVLTDADIAMVVALYKTGLSIAFCKQFLNIGQTRLCKILRQHGVTIRGKRAK